MNIPVALAGAMAISVSMVIIPLMWRLAPRLGMLDQPDARKVHSVPTPRTGGWGILLGALIPTTIALWPLDALFQSFVFGALVLLTFGAADDRADIGHWGKFVGQFIAVVPVVYYGGLYVERLPFLADPISAAFGMPFTVFAMVGMINAINHSDGLDGLAGGESLLSLFVIALLAYLYDGAAALVIAVATIGGVLGFLRYNSFPARVFMGDAGSQFLGFTVGFLAVLLTQQVNPALSPAIPALLLGLPIIDILAVLAQRIYHRMHWLEASRNHIHHRLLDLGFVHFETVVIIYSIQTLFVISAVFLRFEWDRLILGLYLGICALLFLLLTVAERKGWKLRRATRDSRPAAILNAIERNRALATAPFFVVAVAIPAYVLGSCAWVHTIPRDFGVVSSVLFVVLLLELVFGRSMRSLMIRAIVHATAVFVVYLTMVYPSPLGSSLETVEIGYFLVLAVALTFAIRHASEREFTRTPMDYLVLFIVLAIVISSLLEYRVQEMGELVVKGLIILYGCELLMNKAVQRWSVLSLSSLAALGIMSIRGLMGLEGIL